jgi:5-methylcytosine-specific restriction endonuclease McrA
MWARLDGGFCTNIKVRSAGPLAVALWASSLSYCAQQLTDGFVPASEIAWLANIGSGLSDGTTPGALAEKLVEVGLFDRLAGGFKVHDYLKHNPSARQLKAEREANRLRQAFYRDERLKAEIRERDGDRCGYCRREVTWGGHDATIEATFDRINPKLGYTKRNVVVACGACNRRKGKKTLAQAGMRLERVTANVERTEVSTSPVPSRNVPSRCRHTENIGKITVVEVGP